MADSIQDSAELVPSSTIVTELVPGSKVFSRGHEIEIRHLPWIGLVLLAVFYLYSPLLSPYIFETHEKLNPYLRAYEYTRELRSGFWQAMLLPDAVHGAGIAFPLYYPSLSYYVAALVTLVSGNAIVAVNFCLFLSVILTAMGSYACGWSVTQRAPVAAIAAVFSVTVTYRFVNIFVRGALGECWGAAWATVAIYGALELARRGKRGHWLSVGLAGVACSHTMLLAYLCPAIAVALFPYLLVTRRWGAFLLLGLFAITGMLISAWYLVPMQAYLDRVWVSDFAYMGASRHSLLSHRVKFAQLFLVDAKQWFGSSMPGPSDSMSYQLGVGYLLVAGSVAALLGRLRWHSRPQDQADGWLLLGILAACVLMVQFMVLPILFFWLPEPFWYLQFPWRLLSILPAFAAPLLAITVNRLFKHMTVSSRIAAALSLCAVLVVCVQPFFTAKRFDFKMSESLFEPQNIRKHGEKGFTDKAEYMPLTYPVQHSEQLYIEQPLIENGQLINWSRDSGLTSFTLQVRADGVARATLPITYYPFWFAEDSNGNHIGIESDRGFVALQLSPGDFHITLWRKYTRPYYIGWLLTLSGVLALVMLSWAGRRRESVYSGAIL